MSIPRGRPGRNRRAIRVEWFGSPRGEHVAQITLESLEVLNGHLPARALRLVREWARLHADELARAWELAQALEPLFEIDPLP
jgi:hypothetical protein